MRRTCVFVLLAVVGCGGRSEPQPTSQRPDARQVVVTDAPPGRETPPLPQADKVVPSLPPLSDREAHDFYFQKAVDHIARREYADALTALKEAQKKQDSGTVQREIDRVAALLAQQEAGEKATHDVKAVLDDGKPGEAARLAQEALNQFGGGDQGGPLTRLHTQAEAELTAEADNTAARRAALKVSAEAALAEGNLRAAVVAMEQAQAIVADAEMAKQLEGLRKKLADYDDNRRCAAEARLDPTRLDEALTRLRAAKASWDTLQIRQEIDEATLLAERRRDRLSVADFEVRGDVGMPSAGQAVAEELLGRFKGKYDLVERGQIAKLAGELKLEAGDLLGGGAGRRELGRLARVRYLVVGSITPLAGITVQARLVEVATGLIVQTARVSAPNPEALLHRLRDLAVMLQMDDAAKAAYEEKLIASTEAPKAITAAPLEEFPAPPLGPPAAAFLPGSPPPPPPPPIATFTPCPPPMGGMVFTDFAPSRLPPLLVADAPPPPPPVAFGLVIARDKPRRNRMLRLSLELGDNLFRRGRFREAQRHFGLALTLAGPRREISLRLDACRHAAPPPPSAVLAPVVPIAVAPAPFVVVAPPRPRLAVFAFVPSNPRLVPDRGGEILADQMAGYFGGQYEVVDRGEVSWFMGRLGITMRDVLADPVARRALSESLNTRFFLFTALRETASMNAESHLVDAQTGVRTATASIHVQDDKELRLRLGEIAGQLGARPAARAAMAKTGAASEKALSEARALMAREPARAAAVAAAALKAAPDSVALRTLQAEALRRQKRAAYEASRKKDQAARAIALEVAKKRQQELAIATAQARARSEAAARGRSAMEAAKAKERRDKAAAALQARARAASAKGDARTASHLLHSASTLRPSEAAFKDLARAKLLAEAEARKVAQAAQAKREAAALKQREAAAARVEKERRARLAADAARKKAHDAQDIRLRDSYIKQSREAIKAGKLAEAMAAAQAAQSVRPSPEGARLVSEAQHALSLASARNAAEKKKLEAEKAARAVREAETARRRTAYTSSLTAGAADVKAGRYAEAIAKYEAAAKLFPGDAVAVNGLKAARELKARQQASVNAAKKAVADREARLLQLANLARAAEQRHDYAKAVELRRVAIKLVPGDVALKAALTRTEGLHEAQVAKARREQEAKGRAATVAKLIASGKKARTPKEAIDAYRRALAHDPANAEAKALLARTEATLPRPVDPQLKKRQEDHRLALDAGDAALKANNFKGAANAYREAVRLMPTDATGKARLASAEQLYRDALERENRVRVEAAYGKEFAAGTALHRAGKYAEAVAAFDRALAAKPGDKQALLGKRLAQEGLKTRPVDPRKAAYNKTMVQAGALVAKHDFAGAKARYEEALRLSPADPAALKGRAHAEASLRAQEYQTWYGRGQALLAARKHAEAATAFDNALKARPGDRAAIAGKQAAMAAGKPPVVKPPVVKPPASNIATYNKQLAEAHASEKAAQWVQASARYTAALAAVARDPGHIREQARAYAGIGRCEHAQKQFVRAIKAYDEALKRDPRDGATAAALARARKGM